MKTSRAALLASAPASVRARNTQPSGGAGPLPPPPVAPPAPGKRPGRGSGRPPTQGALLGALLGALDASAGVVVELPGLRLVNPLNQREHWRSVSTRGKREKAATAAALRGKAPPALPVVVTITRVSTGRLDSDGCVASAKHVRDAVAAWLGCDDADPRIAWRVMQARGKAAVRITVGPRVVCPTCGCVAGSEEMGR